MIKKTLFAAIALTLTAGAVHADSNKLSKSEGAGMLTGAAAGAIVGGPVGAFVGMMIGGIVGDSADQAQTAERRAQAIEDELIETRRELALASQQPRTSTEIPADSEVMFAGLAERLRADVMFRTNSTALEVSTQMQLKELGALLAAHPNLAIEVHGFADPRGKSQQNQALSAERAERVRSAIAFGGAAPDQIAVSAHGEELARAAKNDLEAYAWERRVTLTITPNTGGQVAQSR